MRIIMDFFGGKNLIFLLVSMRVGSTIDETRRLRHTSLILDDRDYDSIVLLHASHDRHALTKDSFSIRVVIKLEECQLEGGMSAGM